MLLGSFKGVPFKGSLNSRKGFLSGVLSFKGFRFKGSCKTVPLQGPLLDPLRGSFFKGFCVKGSFKGFL